MRITTRYTSKASGAGVIVAKGGGKQRTVNYDPALSIAANHGAAAGTLGAVLGLPFNGAVVCLSLDNGSGSFEV